jgi:hypothetical protein
MKLESAADAKKTIAGAISSGCPGRPIGVFLERGVVDEDVQAAKMFDGLPHQSITRPPVPQIPGNQQALLPLIPDSLRRRFGVRLL